MATAFTSSNFYRTPKVREQQGTLKTDDPVAAAQNTEADNAPTPAEPTEVVTVTPATTVVKADRRTGPELVKLFGHQQARLAGSQGVNVNALLRQQLQEWRAGSYARAVRTYILSDHRPNGPEDKPLRVVHSKRFVEDRDTGASIRCEQAFRNRAQ